MHKYDLTPPEYIYVDIRCQGKTSDPAQGASHMILYGIEGKQNDANSDVYDSPYCFENDEMTLPTEVKFEHGIDVKNNVIQHLCPRRRPSSLVSLFFELGAVKSRNSRSNGNRLFLYMLKWTGYRIFPVPD